MSKRYRVPASIFSTLSLLSLVALLTGCSGGGKDKASAAATQTSDSGIEATYGAFTTRVVGAAQPPVVSTSTKAAITGVAGASFTTIYQNSSAESLTLNNTRIAFEAPDDARYNRIYTVPATRGTPTQITSGQASYYAPAWQPAGTKILCQGLDSHGVYQIYTVSSSGGASTQITSSATDKLVPRYSPDGTKILYTAKDNWGVLQIYTIPATGGTPTAVTTGTPNKYWPTWSPDGKWIAYYAVNSRGNYGIFVVSPTGDGTYEVTSEVTKGCTDPAWSPDGNKLAFTSFEDGGSAQIFTIPVTGGQPTQISTGLPQKSHPSWSPDGTQIAYLGLDAGAGEAGYLQVFTMPSTGGASTKVTFDAQNKSDPAWSPFLNPGVVLIGSGGKLGTGAAGFLFGLAGKAVRSVVAFDTAAATVDSRSAARVANLTATDTGSPDLLFSISSGDSLSKLSYSNYDTANQPKTPVNVFLGTGITGALVAFDSATGFVASVVPYAANRSIGTGTPVVRHEGNTVVLTGNFTGIYDATRANRRTGGAHTVRLDAATGKLLSAE